MEKQQIVLGKRLGDGGQGVVYAVPTLQINSAWPVVYKQYRQQTLARLNADVLGNMVGLFAEIDFERGRWLGEHTAWPAAVVEEDGKTLGFLMRAAPEEFLLELSFAPGARRVAGLEFLLNSPAYVKRVLGVEPTPKQRLALLADIARLLAELHDLEIVIGDLSPKNVLFALEPSPHCFLMDCDSVRFRGESALPQVQTPGWALPEGEAPATAAGDMFKFGLLAIRLFAGEQDTRDSRKLAAIDPMLGRLAERSLAADPAARPLAQAWQQHLGAAALRTSPEGRTAPEPTRPRPPMRSRPLGPPGQPPVYRSQTPSASGTGSFGCVFFLVVLLLVVLSGLLLVSR
ncbi:hypothetical protein OOK36_35610 [Streptomyces sp. NBC_00365]|uniref:hypothetical protein n=1 Tax=Streptomyces sp. NBC_00365 TaxID=2975726 RepID=UPI00225AB1E6|nr:hypothetical protein [Streptomyces sp. NBC_00365]MCX5094100.1 hypothetical protein [Streptomyces sp. NBC_00365]